MWTEGIDHLKISKDRTGCQTWYLSSCGRVPEPTVPLLASQRFIVPTNFRLKHLSVEHKDQLG
jgi:hypothetical protein